MSVFAVPVTVAMSVRAVRVTVAVVIVVVLDRYGAPREDDMPMGLRVRMPVDMHAMPVSDLSHGAERSASAQHRSSHRNSRRR